MSDSDSDPSSGKEKCDVCRKEHWSIQEDYELDHYICDACVEKAIEAFLEKKSKKARCETLNAQFVFFRHLPTRIGNQGHR
jgi:hypothetical protein